MENSQIAPAGETLENILRLSELYYSEAAIRERCISYALHAGKSFGSPLTKDAEVIRRYIEGK